MTWLSASVLTVSSLVTFVLLIWFVFTSQKSKTFFKAIQLQILAMLALTLDVWISAAPLWASQVLFASVMGLVWLCFK
jgi:hypothetical protein